MRINKTLVLGLLSLAGCQAKIYVPTAAFPTLSLTAPSQAYFGECTSVTIQSGNRVAIGSFSIGSATGAAFYSSLASCVSRTSPLTSVDAGNQTTISLFYRSTVNGNDIVAVSNAGSATGDSKSISVVTVHFNVGTGFNNSVNSLLVDFSNANGLYASGNFTSYNGIAVPPLVRLLRDGTLDTNFLNTVGSGPDARISAMQFANDGSGKIIIAGFFSHYQGQAAPHIARIFPDGTLDQSFNPGSGFNASASRILQMTDGSGRFYVAGFAPMATYRGVVAPAIIRLNPDGSPDNAFVTGAGFDQTIQNFALAPDDSSKLYLVGNFNTYGAAAAPRIIKLTAAGTVDPSFAPGSGFNTIVSGVTPLLDGTNRICVALFFANPTTYQGNPINNGGAICLNSDATVDTQIVPAVMDATVFNIARSDDGTGRLFLAGAFSTYGGLSSLGGGAIGAHGNLDPSFNIGSGFVGATYFAAPALDGTGHVYYYGPFTSFNANNIGGLVRLNADGSLDQ